MVPKGHYSHVFLKKDDVISLGERGQMLASVVVPKELQMQAERMEQGEGC